MQKIKKIAKIAGGVFSWCDARGNDDEPPVIPIGANVMLEIDLRQAATSGMTDSLPVYDITELDSDSYSFALDGDYDHATDPKMLMLSGVEIGVDMEQEQMRYIRAIIPNTNYAGLKAAVEANKSIELEGEIAGHDANGVSTFVFNFPIIIRNRVWYPDDAPESVVADPDYLNSAQVQAYIAAQVEAQVAAATAELDGADGTSSFVYVAYASDAAGAGFNLTPSASLPYMAIITSAMELTPPVAADFAAATWTRFIGADGQPGTTTVTGLTLTPQGDWATGTTYAENDAVRHANALWQSLADDNEGNEPADDSEFWQLLVADGQDGAPANAPLFAYNTVSTAMDEGWHSTLAADDVYFRVSLDGGVTWSIAKQLTASQTVVVQYNVDAVTAWNDLVKPAGMAYSVATGAYFRVRFTGGVYGDSAAIEAGIVSQEMRVQFSSTGVIGNPLDWHAEPQEGDRYVRFFNASGSVQQSFTIDTGGLEIETVQLSPLAAPWHTTFTTGDFFMRISTDSGTTFTDAIKIVPEEEPVRVQWSLNGIDYGDDSTGAIWQRWSVDGGVTWSAGTQISGAYAIWLAQGNAGTEQDFLDSLKGEPGAPGAVTRVSLTRPAGDANLHVQLQYSQAGDFSDAVEAILTSVEADRGKVRFFDGEASAAFPADGLGDEYAGQRIVVDLSAVPLQVWLRYRWYAASGEPSGAWRGLYHPSSGGVEEVVSAVQANGTLKVDITGATGQWSADGGSTWHDSGDTITVATGTHTVTFAYVDGYTTPSSQSVTISDGILTTVSAEYYEIEEPTETEGTLVVNITGATGRWSVDAGANWKESGQSLLLTAGSYTITFEPILGYSKPDDIPVTVVAGNITVKSGTYVAQPDSSDPTDYGMTWDNGTEPVLEEGNKVIFVTPTGAGNFSGTSWADAKAGIYTAMLAANDGDVLYLQTGTYTSHLAPVAATKSIGIYGGFTVADGTWATRDGFTNPTTIDATSNPTVPFIRPESGVAQIVDGIACTNFTGGVMLANGGTATVKNCAIYDCDGTASSHAVDNCLILNCSSSSSSNSYIVFDGATNCTFTNCISGSSSSSSSSRIVGGGATNCTFTNCISGSSSSPSSYIVFDGATNCTFTNCSSSSSYGCIVVGAATNCIITNCSSGISGSLVYSGAKNCTIIRCTANKLTHYASGYDITNCVIFGCDIDIIDFGAGTNNAASAYIDASTLELGTDNTLALFGSLGMVATKGWSEELNDTPLADFGDFRPQTGSVLIGAGVAVEGVTTDINGVARPDPPTIGAYEAAPSEAPSPEGLLFATGSNSAGELGLGDSGGTYRSAFSLVGDRAWSAMAAGYSSTIGVSNGELYAWGANSYGQLGLGDTDPRSVPTKVGSATNWVFVAAGKYHAFAINSAGELYAWGLNGSFRLGLNDTDTRSVPTKVGSATNWVAVAAGEYHSIAVNSNGELYAWGANQGGKTGLGTTEGDTPTPTRVGSATNWSFVAARATTSFAINTAGELYAWGYNSQGILGAGYWDGDAVTAPTKVGSATNWVFVAVGLGDHALAFNALGELYAWGYNNSGQLGLGDTDNRNTPTRVGSATNWVAVAAGNIHSAAVNSAGELYTWGSHYFGRLGQGSAQINTPTRVGTGTGWLQVAAGQSHTLATMALTGTNGLLSASGVMDSYGEVSPYTSATWSVDGGTTWNAGGSAIQLPAGTYTLTWGGADESTNAPDSSSVTITAGQATAVQGTYTPNW